MQLKLIASIFAGMLLAAGCQRVFACDDINHRNWPAHEHRADGTITWSQSQTQSQTANPTASVSLSNANTATGGAGGAGGSASATAAGGAGGNSANNYQSDSHAKAYGLGLSLTPSQAAALPKVEDCKYQNNWSNARSIGFFYSSAESQVDTRACLVIDLKRKAIADCQYLTAWQLDQELLHIAMADYKKQEPPADLANLTEEQCHPKPMVFDPPAAGVKPVPAKVAKAPKPGTGPCKMPGRVRYADGLCYRDPCEVCLKAFAQEKTNK